MGWRIAVYWKTDQTFYPGTVQAFDATTGRHHVVYADGDEEHLCLYNESLKWLLPPPFRVSLHPPFAEVEHACDRRSAPRHADFELIVVETVLAGLLRSDKSNERLSQAGD